MRRARYRRRQQSSEWLIARAREKAGLDAYAPAGTTALDPDWVKPMRPARCRWRVAEFVGVHHDGDADKGAHWSGIERCASIHACPVCAAVIRAERAREIQAAVENWQAAGGSITFVTLTMAHTQEDALATTLDASLEGWRQVIQGRWWAGESEKEFLARAKRWETRLANLPARRRGEALTTYENRLVEREEKMRAKQPVWRPGMRERYEVAGVIRVSETTYGRNGWHPHLHQLWFTEKPLTEEQLKAVEAELFPRWRDAVVSLGGGIPSELRGIDIRQADKDGKVVAQYLSKVQEKPLEDRQKQEIGKEVARADFKTGRNGSYMPFELLDAAGWEDPDAVGWARHRWVEYVEATHGRQAITWSRGLRELCQVEEEKTDEQILEDAEQAAELFLIPGEVYDRFRTQPDVLAVILETVEAGDLGLAMEMSGGFSRFAPPGGLAA